MERRNDEIVIKKGALFSNCGKYRYKLWRIWNEDQATVLFIMLNPSTADHTKDDATIRRCIGFAKSWGFGGIYIGNLFGYRTSDPKDLKNLNDSRGPFNLIHLKALSKISKMTICAWGNKQGRQENLIKEFNNLHYLELAKDGTPKHPLYLKKNLLPQPFLI